MPVLSLGLLWQNPPFSAILYANKRPIKEKVMKHILLHGLGQTPESWNGTVKAMKMQPDILCPDLSEWLREKEVCYDTLYHGLGVFCSQISEPINLCGLSLGGVLALQYGIENPGKVNSLVLIGTQYTMPKKLLKFQNIVFRCMPSRMFADLGFSKKEFIGLCKSMFQINFQNRLKEITCPVLVVCGEKDRANKAAALKLKELLPGAEIAIIPNAGHEVNTDTPEELGKLLSDFFAKR